MQPDHRSYSARVTGAAAGQEVQVDVEIAGPIAPDRLPIQQALMDAIRAAVLQTLRDFHTR